MPSLLPSAKLASSFARRALPQLLLGRRLPPGTLTSDETAHQRDQFALLKLVALHGPVFKLWWMGKLTTCMVGLREGRRFLNRHRDDLRTATPDLRSVFPLGFLRAMEGDDHRRYRRRFQTAARSNSPWFRMVQVT